MAVVLVIKLVFCVRADNITPRKVLCVAIRSPGLILYMHFVACVSFYWHKDRLILIIDRLSESMCEMEVTKV
jgi:hypothetical protein